MMRLWGVALLVAAMSTSGTLSSILGSLGLLALGLSFLTMRANWARVLGPFYFGPYSIETNVLIMGFGAIAMGISILLFVLFN